MQETRVTPDEDWSRSDTLADLVLPYRFGLAEVLTKITILREELTHRGEGNPIEHVSSRLKTPASIQSKAARLGITHPADAVASLNDVAGIRVVCSFISDAYRVLEMLTRQPDLTVLAVKDYVAHPKENGYRSIHLIVQIPVFLSTGVEHPRVEVQIRTVAMDFWASVEHKIYYKFDKAIPDELREELAHAAQVSHDLDQRMMALHRVVHGTI
ncbi:GTP pyrophosphokinase [Nocardioides yefusunii]|uniref:GTP pyrophosphokinase family protein n=1 Tax=Nocardioides yefusunii TaxID=2500546 RepID=A0ABW1QZA4_9ACTN|nr:GTP pyrophosphokinase family protein [Nocardioides yefusunii]